MKAEKNSFGRWVAKLVSKTPRKGSPVQRTDLQVVGSDQLKRVSGGTSTTSSGPNKGW
jgi:hypothetical protein